MSKPIVDISVDFDFFCGRELREWDWGHNHDNAVYINLAWHARYISQDVYAETDPEKYCDILPEDFIGELFYEKGLGNKDFRFAVCDDHSRGYEWFRQESEPDLFINIDAHHDLRYGMNIMNLDCGNWIGSLRGYNWRRAKFLQVYPRWRIGNEEEDLEILRSEFRVEFLQWADWAGLKGYKLRSLLIARSAPWVAPHHDERFVEMIQRINTYRDKDPEVLDQILQRSFPDREDADRMRHISNREMRQLQEFIKHEKPELQGNG